jgi:hypothetical protein
MMILMKNIGVAVVVVVARWQLTERGPSDPEWIFGASIPFVFLMFLWANWRVSLVHANRFWRIGVKFLLAGFMTGAVVLAFLMNLPQCPTHIEYIEVKQ